MPPYRTHWLSGDEFTADFDERHTHVAIRVVTVLDSDTRGEWCLVAVTDMRRTRFRGRYYLAMLPHARHGFYAKTDEWVPADVEGRALTAWTAEARFLTSFSDEPTLVYAVYVLQPNWPTPPTIIRTCDVRVGYIAGIIGDNRTFVVAPSAHFTGTHTAEVYRAYQGRDHTTNTDLWERLPE